MPQNSGICIVKKNTEKQIVAQSKNTTKAQNGDRVITINIEEPSYDKFDSDVFFARELINAAMRETPE